MFGFFSCVLWFIGGIDNPAMFPDMLSCALFGLKLDGLLVVAILLILAGDYVYHAKIKKDNIYPRKEKR